jgi:hypothetical protein
MDADEHKWIQMAMKHMKKGAFTKQAKAHGETPKEFMKEVLAHPSEHTETTRKRAQFMKNIEHKEPEKHSPEPAPAPAPSAKKAKRPPTEWNKLVQKHHAMVKGQPDAFQKAIQMAKAERAGTGHKAPEPKEEPKAKKASVPKEAEKAPSKKKVQLHMKEYEDS